MTETLTADRNRAALLHFLNTGNDGVRDNEATWECFTDDAEFPGVAKTLGLERAGLTDYKKFLLAYYEALPDATFTPERVVAEGDQVWAKITIRGTHRGLLHGVPATGRPVEYTQLGMYTLRDGKICHATSVFDDVTLLRQIGGSL